MNLWPRNKLDASRNKRQFLRFWLIVAFTAVLAVLAPALKNAIKLNITEAETPAVHSVYPTSGSTAGGNTVTIRGEGLTKRWASISEGATNSHSCAMDPEGKAYCWGFSSFGQLGDGATTNRSIPTPVKMSGALTGLTLKSIAVSDSLSCAIASNDQAYCWGANLYGQLGNNSTANSSEPRAVYTGGHLAGKTIKQVSVGQRYACAIASDDQAYCWGANTISGGVSFGALGARESGQQRNYPAPIYMDGVLSGKTIKYISAGLYTTCVIASDDQVYCWGMNDKRQLGGVVGHKNEPVAIDTNGVLAGKTIKKISVGSYHVCAVDSDSQVYCWGDGSLGQMGNGQNTAINTDPTQVDMSGVLAGKTIKHISSGRNHSCVIASDDQAYCWGANNVGQLGDATTANKNVPTPVDKDGVLADKNVSKISAYGAYTCALASDGEVYCWGDNLYGKLGIRLDGGTGTVFEPAFDRNVPTGIIYGQTPSPIIPVTVKVDGVEVPASAVPGSSNTVQITMPPHVAGPVNITVTNQDGEVTTLTNAYTYTEPFNITSVTPDNDFVYGGKEVTINGEWFGKRWQKISHGTRTSHTCAIDFEGKAYCWGLNTSGQLGDGTKVNKNIPTPIKTDGELAGMSIKDISVGDIHTCAIAANDQVYCWGSGTYGKLGRNSTTESLEPVPVVKTGTLAGKHFKQVSVGSFHSCAIASDDQVYCWGVNNEVIGGLNVYGVLGDNTNVVSRAVPHPVDTSDALSGKTVKSLFVGTFHTCAIASDDQAYCWGVNEGRMGDGTATVRRVPTAVDTSGVLSGKTIKTMGLGRGHTCAVDSEGKAYCWGSGQYGQVGNGQNTASNLSPVQVDMSGALSGKTLREISAGTFNTCAIDNQGKTYCWGQNTAGKLGDGTVSNKNLPTPVDASGVLADKDIKQVYPLNEHTCAIDSHGYIYCWGDNTYGQLGNSINGGSITAYDSAFDKPSPIAISDKYLVNYKVKFGDVEAPSFSVRNNELKVIAPQNTEGLKSLTVTEVGSNFTAKNTLDFTYHPDPGALKLTGISPEAGTVAGGNNATLTGMSLDGLKWKKISIGNSDAATGGVTMSGVCGLTYDGKVYCWGNNAYGQLGNGTIGGANQTSPKQIVRGDIPEGASIIDLQAGGFHHCVIASNGKIYCWGSNASGQLGTGNTTNSGSPKEVDPDGILQRKNLKLDSFMVSQGAHNCILDTENDLYCWGSNSKGQIKGATAANLAKVERISLAGSMAGKTIKKLSAGNLHTCAIANDDTVHCWGNRLYGQLGNGAGFVDTPAGVPVAVKTDGVLAGKTIKDISSGEHHTCVIASDNRMYCWGANNGRNLADGTLVHKAYPIAIPIDQDIKSIYGGGWTTCATTVSDETYCWGFNHLGQAGLPRDNNVDTNKHIATPMRIDNFGALDNKTIKQVGLGHYNSCFLTTEDNIYCSGQNNYGQLGNGTTTAVTAFNLPVRLSDNLFNITIGTANATNSASTLANKTSDVDNPNTHLTFTVPSASLANSTAPAPHTGPVNVTLTRLVDNYTTNHVVYNYLELPNAPTGLSATLTSVSGSNFNIALSWTAPTEGNPITDYIIEYCEAVSSGGCTGSWTIYNDGVNNNTTTTMSNIPASSTAYYSIRIKAKNALGEGDYSNTVTVDTSFVSLNLSSANVSFDIEAHPTQTRFSSNKHDLEVSTNSPNGLTLSLSMSTANTNLVHTTDSSQTVPSTTANASNPQDDLPVNSWGYRVNNPTFGNTTTIETNQATSQYRWAKVQPNSSPDIILQTNSANNPANPTTLPVYYGMKTNSQQPTGTYSGTVVYTVVSR